MLGLLFDACSYISDELNPHAAFLYLINILAFSTINICIVLFSFYMISIVRQTKYVSYRSVYPIIALSVLNIICIVAGAINGKFFSVTDGHLVYGPWDTYITLMPALSVIVLLVVLLMNIKNLGKRNTLALGTFVAFPLNSMIIALFHPDLELAYLAAALSCAVIFTFIRREEIIEAHIREQIMAKVSAVDTLTGLLNRRGFNEAIAQASGFDRLGIVFCDLNALKYTNDTLGHAAGDAYICQFADILRHVFKDHGKICRISGDEFVILLYDITPEQLNVLKKSLNRKIRENNRIASVGYAYGDHVPALELIHRAEQEMYDDKNRYYTETGHDRRRYETKTGARA
ncbi:MAG: GGDEF domain-containing protein [Lachnospiraceae bacterium]|nr:GGDEF domain-containing protein [Lachnospiraceae bacterium]